MKSRFSALDLRAIILELQEKLHGMRLQNIYDITPVGRAFALTFSKTDEKVTVVMESGSRIHSTSFVVEKPNSFPTGFTSKLRKHLKSRRLCSIEQVAFDRIVHMKFGYDSENNYNNNSLHLYLELFAKGNVVLTDGEGKILCLLRPVELKEGKLAVGEKYSMGPYNLLELNPLVSSDFEYNGGSVDMKTLARGPLASFSPQMIDYCARMIGGNKIASNEQTGTLFQIANNLILEINEGRRFCGILETEREIPGSEYLLDPKNPAYLSSFNPLKCFVEKTGGYFVEFKSFNEAVDVYFSRLEAERVMQRRANAEIEAKRKLEAIEKEQQARISGLEGAVESLLQKGQLVTEYAEDVDAALKVARTAVESGMDWAGFGRLIESEKKSSNQRRAGVAALFAGLKLENNQVTLKLGPECVHVDLTIDMSAHANARRLFELRNQARHKMERTVAALTEALKSAQEKIRSEALQSLQKASLATAGCLKTMRKPFWFEKFAWFLSSDGILVVAARDAHQSELLIRKYSSPEDTFVFSDIEGSAVVLIKRHLTKAGKAVPPKTLIESGMFSLAFSRAWEAKIVTSAWWTFARNVSKFSDDSAKNDEPLPFGTFRVEGVKNYLPPTPINLSFGFIFLLSDEDRHVKMEKRRSEELEEGMEELNSALDSINLSNPASNNDKKASFIIDLNAIASVKPEKNVQSKFCESESEFKEKTEASNVEVKEKKSVRGKHGKEKKMKKKYADQDEEERALRLELLGSVSKKELSKAEADKKRESDSNKPKTENQKNLSNNSKLNIQKPRQQHAIQFDYQESEDSEEEESSKDVELIPCDYFTLRPETCNGKSYPFAVAVCFPTSSLSEAAFRVKIVPGSLKKSKAAKSAVSHFISACGDATLKDLIKAVPEAELIKCLPTKVGLAVTDLGSNKKKNPKKRQKKPKN